jgi:hypothetical protein
MEFFKKLFKTRARFKPGDAPLIRFGHRNIYLVVPGKSSKCNNFKIMQGRVTVLGTTLLINAIYQLTKFLVDTSYVFRVIDHMTAVYFEISS